MLFFTASHYSPEIDLKAESMNHVILTLQLFEPKLPVTHRDIWQIIDNGFFEPAWRD